MPTDCEAPSAVGALLATLLPAAGRPLTVHLITPGSERWKPLAAAVEAAAETEARCEMCDKREGCGAPTHCCFVCRGVFCAACDAAQPPRWGSGHHSCEMCHKTACKNCVFWPDCQECGKQLCVECEQETDFPVCGACEMMWCAACAEDRGMQHCTECAADRCHACGPCDCS